MKTIETLKELYPKVNSLLGEIDAVMKEDSKKIKKEYINNMTEIKIQFLKEICEGEGLNFDKMKHKYLTDKERKNILDTNELKEIKNEVLLDTISINNKNYFYENKESGIIFDNKSKPVGVYKNGIHLLN